MSSHGKISEKGMEQNKYITNSLSSSLIKRGIVNKIFGFDLVDGKHNFRPSLTWKINEISNKLEQETFQVKSEVFMWTGYPIQAQAMLKLKENGRVYVSMCLEDDKKKPTDLKLIPSVFYVLNGTELQSGSVILKNRVRNAWFLFPTKFNSSLEFEDLDLHKSWLSNDLYNVDDSVVIEIYIEPPSMARVVHSYNGTLNWAIDNYADRKQKAEENLMWYVECPYFYTGPRGYRVLVTMWLDGYGEHRGSGLSVMVCFLTGEFDKDLGVFFPHNTTVNLIKTNDQSKRVTKMVDKNIDQRSDYVIDICDNDEIDELIENDTLFFNVTIENDEQLI